MRISDWSADVCSSDLIRRCIHAASKAFIGSAQQFLDGSHANITGCVEIIHVRGTFFVQRQQTYLVVSDRFIITERKLQQCVFTEVRIPVNGRTFSRRWVSVKLRDRKSTRLNSSH